MAYTVSIKTEDQAVVVNVSEEHLTRNDDGVIVDRYCTHHEVFVPAGVEHVVFADETTTYLNVSSLPADQKGLRDYRGDNAASQLVGG